MKTCRAYDIDFQQFASTEQTSYNTYVRLLTKKVDEIEQTYSYMY